MTETAARERSHNGGASGEDRPFEQVRSEFRELDEEVRSFVRERPLLALGIAVTAGYLVGRLLSKL
jgi:ElaB/YqjD/DUF883 family membrane-anchored ribosome-binding protein